MVTLFTRDQENLLILVASDTWDSLWSTYCCITLICSLLFAFWAVLFRLDGAFWCHEGGKLAVGFGRLEVLWHEELSRLGQFLNSESAQI